MSDELRDLRAVVLAGTYHWGDSSFGRLLRGPLLPVALAPVISYPLKWLRDGGIDEVTVCANSSTWAVRERFGSGGRMGMRLDYYEDHVPRGAAGCVRDAARDKNVQTIVVVEGSLIPSLSLRVLIDAHRRSGAVATVAVELDRRQQPVSGEQPRSPGGIYVFDREAVEAIPTGGFQDIKESLIVRLHKSGARVNSHDVEGVSPRMTTYETYAAANGWIVTRHCEDSSILPGFERIGEGLRHETSRVDESVRVIGPVLIGPGAVVRPGAVIVGPSTIGPATRINENALVSRSILWRGCEVGAGAVVDQSLLADGAVVKPGERVSGHIRIDDGESKPGMSVPSPMRLTRAVTGMPSRASSESS